MKQNLIIILLIAAVVSAAVLLLVNLLLETLWEDIRGFWERMVEEVLGRLKAPGGG